MNAGLGRLAGWTREALLTGGALLGVLCILVTLAGVLFGVRPLVFESGSMSPTIDTGALALARRVDASTLAPGQIVSVPTASGERVTHRIVTATRDGDAALLRLRGDANSVPDAQTYRVTHADRIVSVVPRLGYAVGWLMGPIGLFLLGSYAAFLLSVIARRPPRHRQSVQATQTFAAHGLPLLLLAVGVGAGAMAPLRVTPTLAAWTDATTVSGTTLTANVPTPANLTCGSGGGSKTLLTWTAVAGASYTVHYGTGGATTDARGVGDHDVHDHQRQRRHLGGRQQRRSPASRGRPRTPRTSTTTRAPAPEPAACS